MNRSKKIALGLICAVSLLGMAAYCSFKGYNNYISIKEKQAELERRKIAWRSLKQQIKGQLNGFNGKAGLIIKDLNTGWQISVNQDRLFASASLVKIPVMSACFYAVNEGNLRLDERLKIKAAHRVLGTGPLKDVPAGAEFSVEKLIELMISESDNTAANVLIERLGFDYLNGCFKKLGLKNTNISRKMMDFRQRREGKENFTTASDVAFLLEEIYNRRLISRKYSQMCLEFLKKQKIRDRIPSRLPVDTLVAHKTGLENGVCHDAGIVFAPKGDFLICVLTQHENKTARPAKKFIAQIAFLAHGSYQKF